MRIQLPSCQTQLAQVSSESVAGSQDPLVVKLRVLFYRVWATGPVPLPLPLPLQWQGMLFNISKKPHIWDTNFVSKTPLTSTVLVNKASHVTKHKAIRNT